MNRKVLLLEPNYHNKYPPMGLMKLAMYYRLQNDKVVFFKGNLTDFIISELVDSTLDRLSKLDKTCGQNSNWKQFTPDIFIFLRTGKISPNSDFERVVSNNPLSRNWLDYYRKQFRTNAYFDNPVWDKVGVTTLFTFYWDITIETIKFAKKICKEPQKNLMVGGVLASVVPDAVEKETGIKPHVGCLYVSHLEGDDPLPEPYTNTPIDALPLDYSILDEIDYQYPATDAYFSYTTRGCVNHCAFCAVPILEPEYQDYIPIKNRIEYTSNKFGEKRHLLLLDNNVFASKSFNKIIDEIKESGFSKGEKFLPPDMLNIAIQRLKDNWNDKAYIRLATRLLNEYVNSLDGDDYIKTYSLLLNNCLLHDYTATKDNIFKVYNIIKEDYQKRIRHTPLVRYVDFNQGMDARLVTPEKMSKLSEICIRPLRIAFDHWGGRKFYVRAIRLAQENGITQMSNYLLYNFRDKPIELYRRLQINIDLCDVLNVNIYSFPMKYHPIMDEKWFTNRDYIDKPHWSRKSIRAIQAILNSTHGKIGRGRTFFYKALGRNENEFEELLKMPEAFIINRWDAELSGLTNEWRDAYEALDANERLIADDIISSNIFSQDVTSNVSKRTNKLLQYYRIERADVPIVSEEIKEKAILSFEDSCPTTISRECKKLLDSSYW